MKLIGPIIANSLAGFIDAQGAYTIPPVFEELGQLREGKLSFRRNEKIGFISETGEVVIAPEYDDSPYSMPQFRCNLACVKKGLFGYIDHAGSWRIVPSFVRATNYVEGRAIIERSDGYYVIDPSGDIISHLDAYYVLFRDKMPAQWDWERIRCVFSCSGGRFCEGTLNWRGEVTFPPAHARLTDFCEGIAGFTDSEGEDVELWGLVSSAGDVMVKPEYYDMSDFREGLASCSTTPPDENGLGTYGYIDNRGCWKVIPQFQKAFPFSGGLACVGLKTKSGLRYGFVDSTGHLRIEPSYECPGIFKWGHAVISEGGGESSVINALGTPIWSSRGVFEKG